MISKTALTQLYQTMVRIRECEESFVEPILKGEIKCPVHLYVGEEAVAAGVCAALSEKDLAFGNHRSHGHYLAKGGNLKALVAEVYGKESGCSKGMGGSMHVIAKECGFLGSVPIVAGTIALATGAALAARIRKQNHVVVSFFGDGATGEGALYESMNLAALKKLPVIFVCENNLYSTHLPLREMRAKDNIWEIAKPFGIASFRIDGNDALKVHETATKAVALCRKGAGPVFIECRTYRMRGHVGPDDNIQGSHTDIRSPKEIEQWRKKDPIKKLETFLMHHTIRSREELEAMKEEAREEAKAAHEEAKKSPYPDADSTLRYTYAK